MSNWKKWVWPGIFTTVLLTALATLMQSEKIENDLAQKAEQSLSTQHSWASVEMDGRDLTLKGVAPSAAAQAEALKLADAAYDVRIAQDNSSLLPVADPYTLSAIKSGDAITLSGSFPSENVRVKLVAAAQAALPNAEITDNTILARGAPSGFLKLTTFGIGQFKDLVSGEISMTNLALSVSGVAASAEAFSSINAALNGSIPAGGKIILAKIMHGAVSPYTWQYSREGETNNITLSGYMPKEDLFEMNNKQVMAAMGPNAKITNTLEIGAGAPDDFAIATSIGINAASRLVGGSAVLNGTQLTVTGEAYSLIASNEIRKQLESSLPAGYVAKFIITEKNAAALPVIKVDECSALLTQELKFNSIKFEVSKSVIRGASFGLLDKLTFVVQRCPAATVEIEGHSDSDGSDELNQRLSEDRANSVRAYLAKAGITESRMKATGYGETKPIASNDTDEGKASNRRIAFTVTNSIVTNNTVTNN